MPEVFGRATGLNAYDAWASKCKSDTCFMTDDERVLQSRHEVHNSAVGIVAGAGGQRVSSSRSWPRPKYQWRLSAGSCRMLPEGHDLMWQVWGAVGGNGNPKAFEAFARPEVRHGLAPNILQARDFDAKAADLIERALSR